MHQTMRNFHMTDMKPENSEVIHGLQKQIYSLKQVGICCQHQLVFNKLFLTNLFKVTNVIKDLSTYKLSFFMTNL